MTLDPVVRAVSKKAADAIHPRQIIAFGSRVRGTASAESDVDLLIVYDGPKSKREIQREVHRLFTHPEFSLDVFVMKPQELAANKHIANTLAREVSEHGVVCYG